jgi:hypothetical protein
MGLPSLERSAQIMPFSRDVADEALVRCARTCCLCRRFAGTAIQTHHIIQEADGGSNDLENCIPLCLFCHEEVGAYNPAHPIGRKFTAQELRRHRDIWFEFVATHPERIGNSADALFRSFVSSPEPNPEVRATVEPFWHETTVWSEEGGHERKEVFAAKVRNQGVRPIYVDSIGFMVGEKKYPGLFAPWSAKPHDEASEVPPGRPQIFSFFEVKMESEDVPLIDGMYLVTGAGHTFENRGADLGRLIDEFQRESAQRPTPAEVAGFDEVEFKILQLAYDSAPKRRYTKEEFESLIEAPPVDVGLSLRKLQRGGYLHKPSTKQLWREGQPNPNGYLLTDKGIELIKTTTKNTPRDANGDQPAS